MACTRCGIGAAGAGELDGGAMALTPNRFGRWCLDECTRAILVAHGFSIGMLAEL
jgi:hypothetical protein